MRSRTFQEKNARSRNLTQASGPVACGAVCLCSLRLPARAVAIAIAGAIMMFTVCANRVAIAGFRVAAKLAKIMVDAFREYDCVLRLQYRLLAGAIS